ncbi:MAG: TRAP transporter large permease subunit [Cellvibrionales bacterium]|nr:TRAP transporter large permease subunit [Cellvibrionales bacterium]
MVEFLPLFLFAAVCLLLLLGYPVALTLAGTALLFAAGGIVGGVFDADLLRAMPDRLYGIMLNETLIAVPLFVLMGVLLEKSRLAEELLDSMAAAFGRLPGGLGISVVLVGMLLAASTGIVGATVVAMGLMSLPTMLARGYDRRFATGTICATGTLGQIIPPSIALVLLGDQISTAYQQAQLRQGIYSTATVSVGDLFIGAIVPGLLLVGGYLLLVVVRARLNPALAPPAADLDAVSGRRLVRSTLPFIGLMVLVLGSIIAGVATPTEAAGVGALGALLLAAARGKLSFGLLHESLQRTVEMTAMVFLILIGASLFSLVFRGFGGEGLVHGLFSDIPGGVFGTVLVVMVVIFLLGFILDFIEITFVVVPIVGPVLLMMGMDPIWLGIMIAINLQTSFLTPPFGFALFYLRGVTPAEVETVDIYRGVVPFIAVQLAVLVALAIWPELATWLPQAIKGG